MGMTVLDPVPTEVAAFLILFARVGAVLMLLPVFSEDSIPARIRLMIAFAMTLGLWGLLSPGAIPVAATAGDGLVQVLVSELLIGLGLGTLVRMMFLAAATAGSIVSLQIGLTSALVPDTMQGGSTTVLSRIANLTAALVCMAMLIHHMWIEAIIHSYAVFPVGGLPATGDFASLAVKTASRSMALAVGLAAPMIVYGIVFNVALGLAARLTPALQIFFVAQPLNLLLGIGLFVMLLGTILATFARAFATWLQAGLG
jgi:flagellar biosynthetic protein FliR